MLELNKSELIQAGAIIFGSQMIEDDQFLERLHLAELKQAYRQKSLQTHPDLFVHLGGAQQRTYTELFQEVREAYEKLCGYLKLRAQMSQSLYPTSGNAPNNNVKANGRTAPFQSEPSSPDGGFIRNPAGAGASAIFDGDFQLPPWRLRTGEFLFYRGVIPWRILIAAILWQGRQRERLGEIACRWGWVSDELLWDLLEDRLVGERVGGILLRHQIVTPFQLKMLLIHQQRQQPPIGSYFLENGFLSEDELMNSLQFLRERNHRFDRKANPMATPPFAADRL
jgi:hypothetical protein